MPALETLTASDFTALRGDQFRVAPQGAPAFETWLVEVAEQAPVKNAHQ